MYICIGISLLSMLYTYMSRYREMVADVYELSFQCGMVRPPPVCFITLEPRVE